MINDAVNTNFNTLCKAFGDKSTCLMECKRKKDDEIVNLICAVHFDGKKYAMTPFAEMVSGNPFDDYCPPALSGGFFEGE